MKLFVYFYPRSPCGERRFNPFETLIVLAFLSTLSLRRATIINCNSNFKQKFLSTLSLRRATIHYDNYNLHCVISIHALLAESDAPPYNLMIQHANFYPRSPCGERQLEIIAVGRVEDFYPRSPCGERPAKFRLLSKLFTISIHALLAESDPAPLRPLHSQKQFLSTLSLRRATIIPICMGVTAPISIHALLAESDT